MDRRKFLKGLAAVPVVAVLPAVAPAEMAIAVTPLKIPAKSTGGWRVVTGSPTTIGNYPKEIWSEGLRKAFKRHYDTHPGGFKKLFNNP